MVDGKDYYCIFVDAQLILHRNWCMVAKYQRDVITDEDDELNCPKFLYNNIVSAILNSFLYSIRKLLRAYSTHKIILLWDRQPYHNAEIIKDATSTDSYKADRIYEYDEVGDKLFSARQTAKYHIIANYKKFGLPSIIHSGYEADYLGRIAALCSTRKSALASYDSDWPFYLTENCPELISTTKYTLTYYDKIKEQCLGADPWEYQKYHSSFYGSHNNLLPTVKSELYKIPFEVIKEQYHNNDFSAFTDTNLLEAQLKSWDWESWDDHDEVMKMITDEINSPVVFADDLDWQKDLNKLDLRFYRELKKLIKGDE